MARIGEGTQASLGAMDFSAASQSAWALADSNGKALGNLGNSLESAIDKFKKKKDEQKQFKDVAKISADKLDAFISLMGDKSGALTDLKAKISDEETPLSQRAMLGSQIDSVLNMVTDKVKTDMMGGQQQIQNQQAERRLNLDERGFNTDQRAAEQRIEAGAIDLAAAKDTRAGNAEYSKFAGPAILNSLIPKIQAYEQKGQKPLISSEQLQGALKLSPEQQVKAAELAMSGLPKEQDEEIRDINFTEDGQPTVGTARYNRARGEFEVIPVKKAGSGLELPAGLAPYSKDFEDAAAETGLDPKLLAAISMHETANGTSNAFRTKNNAMGISDSNGPTAQESVRDSIFRQARTLANPNGPYKNVRTLDDLAGVYAPAGARNDPRGLNKDWKNGVEANMARLGQSGGGGVTAGATKNPRAVLTPEQKVIQDQTIQKNANEIRNQEKDLAAVDKSKSDQIEKAQYTIDLIDQLVGTGDKPPHPGFSSAVGASVTNNLLFGYTAAGTPKAGAEAIINQISGQQFLNAIPQMKGLGALSDAEGKKLEQAASRMSNTKQEEGDYKKAAEEAKQILGKAISRLGGSVRNNAVPAALAPSQESAADRAAKLRQLQGR